MSIRNRLKSKCRTKEWYLSTVVPKAIKNSIHLFVSFEIFIKIMHYVFQLNLGFIPIFFYYCKVSDFEFSKKNFDVTHSEIYLLLSKELFLKKFCQVVLLRNYLLTIFIFTVGLVIKLLVPFHTLRLKSLTHFSPVSHFYTP